MANDDGTTDPSDEGRVISWLKRWALGVQSFSGWRQSLLAVVSGAVSVLALAPFFIWPILFVTLPHLVWLLDTVKADAPRIERVRKAAWIGWCFGFGYFFAGLFWVGEAFLVQAGLFLLALPFAVTLLPAGLALFFAAAAALAQLFWRPGIVRVIALAITIACTEWLRGHIFTGFPWNTLGYALTSPLPLMQTAALIGVYGLSLWVVLVFALPAVAAVDAIKQHESAWRHWTGFAVAVAILSTMFIYGTVRLNAAPVAYQDGIKMRVVQVSVPQREKWIPANQERIFADHIELSQRNSDGVQDNLAGITHVVWPEVAMPFLPLEIPVVAKRIAAMLPEGKYLISGALRRDPLKSNAGKSTANGQAPAPASRRAFNSLMVFNDRGEAETIYDKIHLVPFGEYLPFQNTLEAIGLRQLSRMRGGFTPGITPRPLLQVGDLKNIAGLICYEAIFPGQVSAGSSPTSRPSLYLNVTNDGWFGNTTGPRQHFQQARVRAVETGIPLLRSANNGISAMIDPVGRVARRLQLNVRGSLDTLVPIPVGEPVYARFGDWTLLIQLAMLSGLAMLLSRRRSSIARADARG